jgi:hypothetical protein
MSLTLLRTYPFLIPLVVLLLSEIVKIFTEQMKTGQRHARLLVSGGMPSSHSAFVTSLIIIVGYKQGLESMEFAIAFVFACMIWYDAMSSRRAIGEQAKILNRLQEWQHLTERLGHSLLEVIGGIVLGAAVTVVGIWLAS